jgi:hypothetical protein
MEKKHLDGNAHLQMRTSQISLAVGSTALIITLLMSGFYIADTTTGDSNLRNVLASLGICKPLDETPITFPSATPTPTTSATQTPTSSPIPEASASATPEASASSTPEPTPSPTISAGKDGAPGKDGADGSDGAPGVTGPAGPAGPCSYVLDLALIDGNLVPSQDNTYSLGSAQLRWKDLQLGPGTLYIEDQVTGAQVGVTVIDGALLLDGADSLRIGNIRLTPKGIESIASDEDIEIGNLGDTGYILMARGLKFPDGTIQTTATLRGPTGPAGPRGLQGVQGVPGDPREPMSVGNQDGNQEPPATLDLKNQVFTFTDGTWILPEAKEGSIVYFVMGTGGSAEDIYIRVENLRIIEGGRAEALRDQLWSPFSFAAGQQTVSLVSAVFTDGAWNITGGTLRR